MKQLSSGDRSPRVSASTHRKTADAQHPGARTGVTAASSPETWSPLSPEEIAQVRVRDQETGALSRLIADRGQTAQGPSREGQVPVMPGDNTYPFPVREHHLKYDGGYEASEQLVGILTGHPFTLPPHSSFFDQ